MNTIKKLWAWLNAPRICHVCTMSPQGKCSRHEWEDAGL